MPEESMKKEFNMTDHSAIPATEERHSTGGQERPDLILASRAEKRMADPTNIAKNTVATMPVGTQLVGDSESEYSFLGFGSQGSQDFDFEGFETQSQQPHEKIPCGACVDWNQWNSYHEIIRVYARVFAAIDCFKEKRVHTHVKSFNEDMLKPLTALNFAKAKRYLIQQMQLECYGDELDILRKGKSVKKGKCRLFGLYLDKYGTVRCKGRFDNFPTFVNINYPVLFGTNHRLTHLLL